MNFKMVKIYLKNWALKLMNLRMYKSKFTDFLLLFCLSYKVMIIIIDNKTKILRFMCNILFRLVIRITNHNNGNK